MRWEILEYFALLIQRKEHNHWAGKNPWDSWEDIFFTEDYWEVSWSASADIIKRLETNPYCQHLAIDCVGETCEWVVWKEVQNLSLWLRCPNKELSEFWEEKHCDCDSFLF